ncbi:D-alanyl-D-alanine carboxypeptidase [Sphingomonas kaistensis]|uniref:D-alanyl-D-alanine carboxypeptidase n=1 Tax=Sphingomonas kaistensis TaxID=298708 RepID=A0A7X6BH22_9SPHN|nr:D-alanyl-D-alanine carboxypeptidase [Sphingomonas kaistensis]
MTGVLSLGLPASGWVRPTSRPRIAALLAIDLPSGFNGVLAYARGGRIEALRPVGVADIERGLPITAATTFRWGSATKWLASVAALRLAERGKLRLDAPIVDYLPAFRRDTGSRVTVRHLLSNTSGVPDLLSRRLGAEPELRTSTATAAQIVARFGGGDLMFEPGKGWDYAALNWVMLVAILETVGRTDFATLLGSLVLRPVGMTGARLAQIGQAELPTLAVAYDAATPPRRKVSPAPAFIAASGNIAGTATDAVRAAHGIFHGRLLQPQSRRLLTHVNWSAEDYALGGRVRALGGEPWAWEAGKMGGYRALIAHRLKESETIVLFATGDQEQSVLSGWAERIILS